MKKILIISHAMELGGAERSLLGLLEAFDYSHYEVDLFLLRHEGELLSYIPDEVKLLPEMPQYTVLARPMVRTLREGHGILTAARMAGKLAARRYSRTHHYQDSAVELEYSHKYTVRFMPQINPEITYDMVISFLTPHYIATEKVHAKKRIAWIHTDYTAIQIDRQSEDKMWGRMDHIVSISPAVTRSFLTVFPSLRDKIALIENILPVRLIQKQAMEDYDKAAFTGQFKILSIGRFSYAKNFDNIPEICSEILRSGIDVIWYLIGYGGEESLIREKIREYHMEDHVILLGKKDNPYPYIRHCDLYIQPSRYEGKCVAVREAQMLGKAVLITEYETSAGQLEDGVDGVIIPMENRSCAQAIVKMIQDPDRMYVLQDNCRHRDYSNAEEIIKLYQLME